MARASTKQGYDWSRKYPLIAEALYRLRVTSVVLDGEAMCFTNGMHDFDKLWSNCFDDTVRLCAFDLLELNGEDYRNKPLSDKSGCLNCFKAPRRHRVRRTRNLKKRRTHC